MLTKLPPKTTQIALVAGTSLVVLLAGLYLARRFKRKKESGSRLPSRKKTRSKGIEYDRIFSDLSLRQSMPDQVQAKKKEDIIILHELQLGENYMVNGNFEEGTRHLANAVSMYSNPEKFLKTLKGCLDPAIYKMLLNTLVNGNGARSGKSYPYDPFEKYTLKNAHYYLPK